MHHNVWKRVLLTLPVASAILLSLFVSGCATSTPPIVNTDRDIAEIQALYVDWRRAVEASNIQGYLNVLHEDVRLLPPGAPGIQGRDNYGKFLGPVFDTATYDITVNQLQVVEVIGDAAIAEYDYTIALNRKENAVGEVAAGALTASSTTARYFDVLRKDSTGAWKVWRHSWQ